MNQSICSILQHLFHDYGNITPLELEDNDTKMRDTWDPNSPFDCLVKQIEDGQDYADDGGQPYTAEQLLRIVYTLVFKTGLYFKDCKTWNARPAAQHTWCWDKSVRTRLDSRTGNHRRPNPTSQPTVPNQQRHRSAQ